MALPKKGLRKFVYEGRNFGWQIRPRPTYCQDVFECDMTIAIQDLESDSPKIMRVTLDISRPDNVIDGHKTAITPGSIRKIIEAALEDGWTPEDGGNAYEFSYKLKDELAIGESHQ